MGCYFALKEALGCKASVLARIVAKVFTEICLQVNLVAATDREVAPFKFLLANAKPERQDID